MVTVEPCDVAYERPGRLLLPASPETRLALLTVIGALTVAVVPVTGFANDDRTPLPFFR
jgi:hypothetical protein